MSKIKPGQTLSFSSVLLLGINGIIGSGIFLLPGTLFHEAGWGSVAAIAAAGGATLLIALSYAVMASKIDTDGGAWVYADRAFGAFAGFETGWFGWFLGVITIAAEIAAFLTTLGGLIPAVKHTQWYVLLALVIIGLLTIVNLLGPGATTLLDNVSSAAKVGLLVLFMVVGGIALTRLGLAPTHPVAGEGTDFKGAFSAAFYMFTGFSFLPVAAKQMTNPAKTLPRALLIVMVAVTAVYAVAQAITIGLLGSGLAGESLPVAAAFAVVLGPIGKTVILVGMLASILGVAIAVSFDTPVGMASLATEKRLLPAIFGRTNKKGAPTVAVLATMGVAAALVVSGSYLFLVSLIVLSSFVQYVMTILAMFRLQHAPDLPVGMKLPGGPVLPIVALGLIAYLMTSFTVQTLLIGSAVALIGAVVFILDRRSRKPAQ